MTGSHAPFQNRYLSLSKLVRNCLMAFNKSAAVIRKYAKLPPKIGIAMATASYIPGSESEKDIAKVRRDTFYSLYGAMSNRLFGDPLILGKPTRVSGIYHIGKKDIPRIQTKLDFLGLNVYAPNVKNQKDYPAEKRNYMGWINDGRCIYWALRFFYECYGLPLMITENGTCVEDTLTADGHIHDEKRMTYMKDYIGNVKRAVDEGIPVLGFQYWSLMDNFE